MGLLQRMIDDLRAGIAAVRLETVHAAGRVLEETELLRLRMELRKLDEQLAELYKEIGERALDMKGRNETAERILYDAEIERFVKEVQALKELRAKLEVEMGEIRNEP